MVIVLGMDPGKEGGLSYLGNSGEAYCFSFKNKSEKEIAKEIEAIGCSTSLVFLEKVHSAPGQGVASTFTFGQGYGFLRGCLISCGYTVKDVPPKEWQNGMRISFRTHKTYYERKKHCCEIAKQLYPNLQKLDMTTADAVLIAHYGLMITLDSLKKKALMNLDI